MKMSFPDDSFDFQSTWKSAYKYWQFGTWWCNPWRIALIKVLALRKKCVKSQNVRGEFLLQARGCVHFARYDHSALLPESNTCTLLQAVPSSVCKPAAGFCPSLSCSLHRNSMQPLLLWLSPPAWKRHAGEKLGKSLRHFENFSGQNSEDANSLAFVPDYSCTKSRSCPSEESFQLVNLWVSYAPHGPQPALLQPQCDSGGGKRSTPPAVSLWADLVYRSTADLHLVVELVETVCQVVHCASAQWAALSPGLVGWVFRPLGSDIDVSAEEPKERNWLEINAEWVFIFQIKSKIRDSLYSLRTVWFMPYLECGSKVSLISSGLTKCSDSAILCTDTLSRSRLSLLPSHMLSLEEEGKNAISLRKISTKQVIAVQVLTDCLITVISEILGITYLFLDSGFTSSSRQCPTVTSRQP